MFAVLLLALLGSGFAVPTPNYTAAVFTRSDTFPGSKWEWRDQQFGRFREDIVKFPDFDATSKISTCEVYGDPTNEEYIRRIYNVIWNGSFWPDPNSASSNRIPPPQSADFNDTGILSCEIVKDYVSKADCFALNGWAPLCSSFPQGDGLACPTGTQKTSRTTMSKCLHKPMFAGGRCVKYYEKHYSDCEDVPPFPNHEDLFDSSSYYEVTSEYGWIPNGRDATFWILPNTGRDPDCLCDSGGHAQKNYRRTVPQAFPKHPEIVADRLVELGKCRQFVGGKKGRVNVVRA